LVRSRVEVSCWWRRDCSRRLCSVAVRVEVRERRASYKDFSEDRRARRSECYYLSECWRVSWAARSSSREAEVAARVSWSRTLSSFWSVSEFSTLVISSRALLSIAFY
jgi:hypothetical protein